MNKIKLLAAATIIVTAYIGTAFAENPMVGGAAMYPNKNIIQNAMNSKDHTTLVAAVKAGGLVGAATLQTLDHGKTTSPGIPAREHWGLIADGVCSARR